MHKYITLNMLKDIICSVSVYHMFSIMILCMYTIKDHMGIVISSSIIAISTVPNYFAPMIKEYVE